MTTVFIFNLRFQFHLRLKLCSSPQYAIKFCLEGKGEEGHTYCSYRPISPLPGNVERRAETYIRDTHRDSLHLQRPQVHQGQTRVTRMLSHRLECGAVDTEVSA